MKKYKPPQRLIELDLVLKYDFEEKDCLKPKTETFCINQERAKLLQNDFSYTQTPALETKIQNALFEIKIKDWQPKNPIEYV
jgi:hypothetical protein